jgi:lactate dehydrogenase-like 2-hydroxyacid dehydrogenase
MAPKLRVVSSVSVGLDHVNLAACSKRGIPIGYTPDVLSDSVADLSVALLLATARRLPEGAVHVKKGTWPSVWAPLWMSGKDVHHSTVGLIGMGRIGCQVARRLRGFDCTILYPDRREVEEVKGFASMVAMDELYARSDFVIVLTPLTDSTRGMINLDVFRKMKRDAMLINVSRGPVVNQVDLVKALREGLIAGAGLDVTTPEPLPLDDPLQAADLADRLVIIPHLGSASVATRTNMSLLAVDNLVQALNGRPMPHEYKLHLSPQHRY